MHRIAGLLAVISLLTVSACLFGSDDDNRYEDSYEQRYKVITGEIDQLFDNGYKTSLNGIIYPNVYSEDGFYLVESPEMLDSVFFDIYYAGIDTLFPENGMLLILSFHLIMSLEVAEYTYSFNDDTVFVDLTIRRWLNHPSQPGILNYAFPIGITLK